MAKETTTKKEGKIKEPQIVRTPNFAKYYVTNVKGGLTNQDFRIELLNEKIKEKNSWFFISDAMLILSPVGAKRLLNLLKELVETHEKEKGIIKTDLEEKTIPYDKSL